MVETERRRRKKGRGRRKMRIKEEIAKGKMMEIKKVAEKWEIWDKEEKVARSEEEVKKLVPKQLYKWIKVFGKKASERIPTRKMWDHVIELKKRFVPRKEKIYPLSREEREKVRKFIQE